MKRPVLHAFHAALVPTLLAAPVEVLAASQVYTVTTRADVFDGSCDAHCSLRDAIVAANAHPGTDVVRLLSGTYTFTRGAADDDASSGDLDILDSIVLEVLPGAGGVARAVIDAAGLDDVFEIDPASVGGITADLSDLEVRGGYSPGRGGGIDNQGTLVLTRCRVTRNIAGGDGGGITNTGTLVLIDSMVDQNSAGVSGGGIDNEGSLSLLRSVLWANEAGAFGGGLLHLPQASSLVVESSTISANRAFGGNGGGLFLMADASIADSTFADNEASGVGSAIDLGGATTPVVSLAGSIVAGACGDPLVSLGGNVESPGASCLALPQPSDQVGIADGALGLGLLTDNGGPTPSHRPGQGSVALDVEGADCLAVDQRGVARPQDGDGDGLSFCDAGAVERLPADPVSIFADDFELGTAVRWGAVVLGG